MHTTVQGMILLRFHLMPLCLARAETIHRLPIDFALNIEQPTEKKQSMSKYIDDFKKKLQHDLAHKMTRKSQDRQKQNYDT